VSIFNDSSNASITYDYFRTLTNRDDMFRKSLLQLYGNDYPNGIGGVFDTVYTNHEFGDTISDSIMFSGHFRGSRDEREHSPKDNEVWKGFATGVVLNRTNPGVVLAYNTDPNDVSLTFQPSSGAVKADINVKTDGTGTAYSFKSDWNDTNAYIDQGTLAIVKDINGIPAYVGSTGHLGGELYDYLSWGVWGTESVAVPDMVVQSSSSWVVGNLTKVKDMPTTGTATYHGNVVGYREARGVTEQSARLNQVLGSSTLTADFRNKNITGELFFREGFGRGVEMGVDMRGVSITDNKLSGNLGRGDIKGNIHGAFYGPKAQEVGGNWMIETKDWKATGVFSGKKEKP